MARRLVIRADGAARGNPGPAAAGAVLVDADLPNAHAPNAPPLAMIARPLGIQTNNHAEYTAVVLALELAHRLRAREVELILDSKLVVEQLAGRWKVKNAGLRGLHARAQELLAGFDRWVARHEPRASNTAADALANLALDDPPAAAAAELTAPTADPSAGHAPTVPPAPAGPPRSTTDVAAFVDHLLDAPRFRRTEPENGLLVDVGRPVSRIGAAVNTTFAAIDAAAAAGVELLLVHHASWPDIDRRLHEPKMSRLHELGISLYCAHASLDAAVNVGTADALAEGLGIAVDGRFAEYEGGLAGIHGRWSATLDDLVASATRVLGAAPEVQRGGGSCRRIGVVAGAGGLTRWLEEAHDLGCDTFVTGEGSMYTRLFAREVGLNLLLGGHYRTETPGVRALAAEVARQLSVEWVFVDDEPIG